MSNSYNNYMAHELTLTANGKRVVLQGAKLKPLIVEAIKFFKANAAQNATFAVSRLKKQNCFFRVPGTDVSCSLTKV